MPKTPANRPSLFAFTSTPFFPLSPSLTSFDLQTTMIKPGRSTATDSCELSLTIQLSYTLLTVFLLFLYISAVLTFVSTYSRHRPRRLGPLSKGGLCIRGQPLPNRGGHRIQFEVLSLRLLFLVFCVIHTHRHLRLCVTSPSATTASLRWDRCPPARCCHSFSHSSGRPHHTALA